MIAERIKKLREEKGMSQAELAHIMGVSRMTINNYEMDKRSPDIAFVLKLADYFFVTVEYLIGKSEFKHQDDKEYTAEKVARFMEIAANLPQQPLQSYLVELSGLLEQAGEHKTGEEMLFILQNSVTLAQEIQNGYDKIEFVLTSSGMSELEDKGLTDGQIQDLRKQRAATLYQYGFDGMLSLGSAVQSSIERLRNILLKTFF